MIPLYVYIPTLASCVSTNIQTENTVAMQSLSNRDQPTLDRFPEAEDLDSRPDIVHIRLRAGKKKHTIFDWTTGKTITVEGYAYNDMLPGPIIRIQKGNTLIVDVFNDLEEPTTIHWHGLQVPMEMDGVSGHHTGLEPILPQTSKRYEFTVQQTGTFWYHPHYDTANQVNHGLYGAIIVEDPTDPDSGGIPLIVDDWTFPYDGDGSTMEHFKESNEGIWTVNGLVYPKIELADSNRLRWINASNTGYIDLDLDNATWIANDQGILSAPQSLESALLVPGDRIDILSNTAIAYHFPYSHLGGERFGEKLPLAQISTTTTYNIDAWNFTEEIPSADPSHTDVFLSLQGDTHSNTWMINGEVFPMITPMEIPAYRNTIVEIRNVSPTEHPLHIHGLRFEVLSIDGIAPLHKRMEDTINIAPLQRIRILLYADNIGDWMTHCHILPHGEHGMMTILRVR